MQDFTNLTLKGLPDRRPTHTAGRLKVPSLREPLVERALGYRQRLTLVPSNLLRGGMGCPTVEVEILAIEPADAVSTAVPVLAVEWIQ